MTKLDELYLENQEQLRFKYVTDKEVHQGIVRMCDDMIDEDPSLIYTILGNIKLSHLNEIKELDVSIDYLNQEINKLKLSLADKD
jgi:hypothetical protein